MKRKRKSLKRSEKWRTFMKVLGSIIYSNFEIYSKIFYQAKWSRFQKLSKARLILAAQLGEASQQRAAWGGQLAEGSLRRPANRRQLEETGQRRLANRRRFEEAGQQRVARVKSAMSCGWVNQVTGRGQLLGLRFLWICFCRFCFLDLAKSVLGLFWQRLFSFMSLQVLAVSSRGTSNIYILQNKIIKANKRCRKYE